MEKLTDIFFYHVPIVSASKAALRLYKKKVPCKGKYSLENTFHVEDGRLQKCEVV
jgi:hypothetical protein